MSTRERVYDIIDSMTDEQLEAFLLLFSSVSADYSDELISRIDDIENNRNLSRTFDSVEELMEDLDAED